MSTQLADGIFYNEPHKNAPDFVLASMSIRPDLFINWLKEQTPNEHGYVKLTVKRGRNDKPYVSLDTWEKTQRSAPQQDKQSEEDTIDLDSIPF